MALQALRMLRGSATPARSLVDNNRNSLLPVIQPTSWQGIPAAPWLAVYELKAHGSSIATARAKGCTCSATSGHAVPDSGAQRLPLTLTGQVVSAASNLVRVELDPPTSTSNNGQADPSQAQPPAQQPALPRSQLLCSLRMLLKKVGQTVLVGDRVRVGSMDWAQGKGQVEEVLLPRTSELTDPAVANVDFALLCFALANPPFEELQVSRFLVSMEASGLPFRLLLNKSDLVEQEVVDSRVQQVRSWGYEPLVVSCETGRGLDEVLGVLAGRTSVIAGPSGAGKSSLINALRLGRHRPDADSSLGIAGHSGGADVYGMPPLRIPESALQGSGVQQWDESEGISSNPDGSRQQQPGSSEDDSSGTSSVADRRKGSQGTSTQQQQQQQQEFLKIGELSRIGRGMHTTTSVSLISLPQGGRLADTPGFSQPTLEGVSSSELGSLFPDFVAASEAAGGCRFGNCLHVAEPGCVVREDESLVERHKYYVKFLAEVKAREESDVRMMQAGKRAREGTAKVKADKGGRQRVEAKLEASKHRRVSRTRAKQSVMDALMDAP